MPQNWARRLRMRWLRLAFWIAAVPALAQLPTSRLASIYPPGVPLGGTNEVTVTGEYLDEATGLQFSDARITALPKPGAANKFVVAVPSEVPEGFVDVRLAGRFGVSNPRALAIGKAGELLAPGSNTAAASAFDIPLNRIINGRIGAASDQWFHFAAKTGQRIIVQAETAALDSRLEPVLTVFSSDHRELAQGRRGVLDFTSPSDGHFSLRLHDRTYQGGEDYTFRLILSTAPHLEFAIPPALQPGGTNRGTVFGRNIPGSQRSEVIGSDGHSLEQLEVEIAGPSPGVQAGLSAEYLAHHGAFALDPVLWRFTSINGVSNPLLFSLSSGPVSGMATSMVATVRLPCEQGGLFPRRHEQSGIRFEAKKDASWRIELLSDRLGFRTAPGLMLQRITKNDKGAEAYSDVEEIRDADRHFEDRDFNTSSRDISAVVKIPEDGSYRIVARDYYHAGDDGPRYPYLLRVVQDAPDFRLAVIPAISPKASDNDRSFHVNTACLRPGETAALRIYILRRCMESEIEIAATNLPAGVASAPVRLGSSQNTGVILLTAAESAVSANASIQIVAKAVAGKAELVRIAAAATVIRPVGDYDEEPVVTRLMRENEISVAGHEIAPITIAADGAGPFEVAAGGQIKIPLRVKKRLDFAGNFKIKPAGHTALDKGKEVEINPGATNATAEFNLGDISLPEGLHTIWLQGAATVKYRSFLDTLASAEAELSTATKAASAAKPEEKKAADERVKTAQERKKSAEERAKPRDIPVMIYTEPFVIKVIPAAKTPAKS